MNTQISFLVPTFFDDLGQTQEVEDHLFENQGTLEEMMILGPQNPIGARLSSSLDSHPKVCIELVHLHATRDHIVLMDPGMLHLQANEEVALRTSVLETIEHFLGSSGEFGTNRWIFSAGDFADLKTHSPSQAMGLNMDIWMPKDLNTPGIAKKWRQLQNEIQMIWHDHPINEARLARGELPVNSVWMYGIGRKEDIQAHPFLASVTSMFSTHPLGDQLDPRIKPLRTQLHLPAMSQHHMIFAQDLKSFEWQSLWSAAIEALQLKKIQQITCLSWRKNTWVAHHLKSSDLKGNLLTQLFSKKGAVHPFSEWQNFAQQLQWSSL
jgi:hypothetical protein